ncbi:small multi-drug export protein [bacterium]|nr:small multi-drug export protein [bacterium]
MSTPKRIFLFPPEKFSLVIGLILLGIEVIILIFLFIFNITLAGKVLAMIAAYHLGGRLAFISTGVEFQLSTLLIILIIIYYNTNYLLILFSFISYTWKKSKKLDALKKFVESKIKKAQKEARVLKKFHWAGIALFVWLPFPMTGAVMGFLIATIEGYSIKKSILIVIPSMWVGVLCWTILFEDIYKLVKKIDPSISIILTLFLVFSPFLYSVLKKLIWKKSSKS